MAEEIKVFEFTEEEFDTFEVKKVRGADANTKYSLGSNKNGNFLKAEANNAASGLGKKIKINLNKTPYLNITWKVEKDLRGIDEINGVAIMADTDNSKLNSISYYQNIYFSAE